MRNLIWLMGALWVWGDPGAASVELKGKISSTGNRPITNAEVFIYAGQAKGDADLTMDLACADCGRKTITDGAGNFILKGLDAVTRFEVVFRADGFRPMIYWRVEPGAESVEVKLRPAVKGANNSQEARGRVLDPNGKAIAGALAQVHGAHRREGWSEPAWEDFDAMAFTDEAGEFVIRADAPFIDCDVAVEARGYAPSGRQHELKTGGAIRQIVLSKGAEIKGRLVQQGKPVAGAGIEISGAHKGRFSVNTDEDGRFRFANIPPNEKYRLYGMMQSLKERGAVGIREVEVAGEGSSQDVGELQLEPGFKLEGVLRYRDGAAVEPNFLVALYSVAMGPTNVGEILDRWIIRSVGQSGRFQFSGIPAGPVMLTTKGPPFYHLSDRNFSGDPASFRLIGRMVTNKTDLILELVRGEGKKPAPKDVSILSQQPLTGAEGKAR